MRSGRTSLLLRIVATASIITLAACGGGGGGGGGPSAGPPGAGESPGGDPVNPARLGPGLGQALLGPIVDAPVEVYDVENLDGALVCAVTTSSADAPEGPGVVDLGACPISSDSVYFLLVAGGSDIDADDDGVVDETPTPKDGSLRAIVSGQRILDGDFRINIVTEIAYQSVSDALLSGAGGLEILLRLDGLARQLLSEDIDGDGIVDNGDLVGFSPAEHASLISGSYGDLLGDILAAILTGDRQELTLLSRQLLLSSLGEYRFVDLVTDAGDYQNLLISDFAVEDGFVYAVGYDAGSPEHDLRVFIIDATDFSAVSLVGEYYEPDLAVNPQRAALDMLKAGDVLYVASQGNGLFVIDVSDPAMPAASRPFEDNHVTGLALRDGSTMYVGHDDDPSGPRGIHVVDITDPATPQIVGSTGPLTVFDMLYADELLYVYGPGIAVFDASDPTSLSQIGSVSLPAGSNTSIAYRDGFIYAPVTDTGLQGMTIVDVRDRENPARVGDFVGLGLITKLDVYEQTLYATASTAGEPTYLLNTFAIGDDGMLRLSDSRSTPAAFHLQYENGRVYLASSTLLTAYDADSLHRETDPVGFMATDKTAHLVEVVGTVAYVANGTELLAIDVSDPDTLQILDGVSVIDRINDMEIVDHHAYLANATEGLKIVDIGDPADLQVVGSNAELTPLYDDDDNPAGFREMFAIEVQDGLAYTVTGGFPDGVIGVFDVTDPAQPVVVRSAPFPFPLGDIALRNDTVYGVDTGPTGASLFTIAVDDAPRHLDTMDWLSTVVELDGTYLYTTSGTAGLAILSVSDDRNPVPFGNAPSLGIGNAISIVGDVAYVANGFGMVEVYDIADRTQPVLAAQYPIGGVVEDVFATEDYVYAVNGLGLVVERAARLHDVLD